MLLLGLVLLRLFPDLGTNLGELAIPIILAIIGFIFSGLAKGFVDIVLLVLGALAGAEIVKAFMDLFGLAASSLDLLFVIVGAVIGVIMIRTFKDWAMIILSGLIGALLITHGLTIWLPFLQGILGSLLVIVLAGSGCAYQGGLFTRLKAARQVKPATGGDSAPSQGDQSTPTSNK